MAYIVDDKARRDIGEPGEIVLPKSFVAKTKKIWVRSSNLHNIMESHNTDLQD